MREIYPLPSDGNESTVQVAEDPRNKSVYTTGEDERKANYRNVLVTLEYDPERNERIVENNTVQTWVLRIFNPAADIENAELDILDDNGNEFTGTNTLVSEEYGVEFADKKWTEHMEILSTLVESDVNTLKEKIKGIYVEHWDGGVYFNNCYVIKITGRTTEQLVDTLKELNPYEFTLRGNNVDLMISDYSSFDGTGDITVEYRSVGKSMYDMPYNDMKVDLPLKDGVYLLCVVDSIYDSEEVREDMEALKREGFDFDIDMSSTLMTWELNGGTVTRVSCTSAERNECLVFTTYTNHLLLIKTDLEPKEMRDKGFKFYHVNDHEDCKAISFVVESKNEDTPSVIVEDGNIKIQLKSELLEIEL